MFLGEPLQGGPGSKVQLPQGLDYDSMRKAANRGSLKWPYGPEPYRSHLCSAINVKWTLSPARKQCWSVALHLKNSVKQKLAEKILPTPSNCYLNETHLQGKVLI